MFQRGSTFFSTLFTQPNATVSIRTVALYHKYNAIDAMGNLWARFEKTFQKRPLRIDLSTMMQSEAQQLFLLVVSKYLFPGVAAP